MNAPLLQVRALGKRFGGFVALSGIDVSVARAERVGLIGPNGSGKSTFVNCLGGFFAWHEGDIEFDGAALNGVPAYRRAKLGLARTFQLPRAFASLTVAENVEIPLRFLGSDGPISVRAREGLERVGLAGKANSRPGELTQADLRRLELARALACRPKLLIADEAMAGLSHSEVDEILALAVRSQRRRSGRPHDRAHHARGHCLRRTPSGVRRRPQNRRRPNLGGPAIERSRGGLSWRMMPFPSAAS